MSALRLSVPGYPTRLIDEGPATPHRIHGFASVPVAVVGAMQPFVSTAYGENRPKHRPPRAQVELVEALGKRPRTMRVFRSHRPEAHP